MPALRAYLFTLFLPFSLFLQGCDVLSFKDKVLDLVVDRIPLEVEEAIGKKVLPTVLPDEAILKDPESLAQLNALLDPLFKSNQITSPRFRVLISRDPQLNAFALPGGILVFNAGLLRAAASPEEILGVAAHEIAHATERHVLKSMVQTLSLTALISLFIGDMGGLAALLIQQGQILLQNGFSRGQEAAADRVGFEYLVKARLDPRGMTSFFQRIQAEAEKKGAEGQDGGSLAKIESFYSTHPLTSERIKNVESWREELPAPVKNSFRASAFPLRRLQASVEAALGNR